MEIVVLLLFLAISYLIQFIVNRKRTEIEMLSDASVLVSDRIGHTIVEIKRKFNLEYIKGNYRKFAPVQGEIGGNKLIIKVKNINSRYYYQVVYILEGNKSHYLIICKKGLFRHLKLNASQNRYKVVIVPDNLYLRDVVLYAEDETAAAGIFNLKTRKMIDFLNESSSDFYIKEKEIFLSLNAEDIKKGMLERIIRQLSQLSMQLEKGKNVFELLKFNVQHDPVAAVRLDNLKKIVSHYGNNKEVKQICSNALKDSDFEVIIFAARTLGKNIYNQLKNIISNSEPSGKMKAIKMLGQEKMKQSIPFLKEYYDITKSTYIKIETIMTLKKFGDQKTSKFLIEQSRSSSLDIRRAAVEALAACGKKSAIAPLHKLAQDASAPTSLRKKAADAIDRILSRIGDTGEGRLSVAAPTPAEGSLSLKENAAEGDLSIADDDLVQNQKDNS
jgi:hypothetical protein